MAENTECHNCTDFVNDLQELEYPVSLEQFLDEHGSVKIELQNAKRTVSVEELVDSERLCTSQFKSPTELAITLKNQMGSEFVGRERYDDRGGVFTEEMRFSF